MVKITVQKYNGAYMECCENFRMYIYINIYKEFETRIRSSV